MPKVWFAIAACEQPVGKDGTQWDAYSYGYEGAFGFAHTTWQGYRPDNYPQTASQASAWQQYKVALRVYADWRFSPWGCYVNGGYTYHLDAPSY